ncbi:hypothetical protein [Pseudobutyrivibrio sp.]|uniref:hypothetical protein n=1 Tax=Pseudobutyrivibrio sp. TaxID=2014367 RepID=UPI001DC7E62F|nr:hypothetical protein [Pseudobutyrivibrio sp.]MBE5912009.1 hypothetical protein [Pseudobutyrivibrio sp.]
MGKFEIYVSEIKNSGSELDSEKNRLVQLGNELNAVNLRGIGGNSQLASLQESIEMLKQRVNNEGTEMGAVAESLGRIANLYGNSESRIMSALESLVVSDNAAVGAVAGIGAIAGGNLKGVITNEVTDLDDAISDMFPNKSTKKLAKNVLKKALKEIKPGSEKIVDIRDIVKKIEKGDIFGALEKLPGLKDVKSWDFKKLKNVAKGSKDFSGIMDADALKFQAAMKTFKLVTDSDGYTSKYKEKYETEAMNYLSQGNVFGTVHAISSEFVQTVGKGTVDVACQLVSGGLDSAVKTMTFGLLDLSTINAALEDSVGFSPGTMFNATTDFISDGVDYILDDLIPGAGEVVANATGKAVSAGGKVISSGIDLIKKLF